MDFGALKRSPILKPKLEAEKVVLGTRGGTGGGLAALILMEDIDMYRNKDQIGNH